jgi:hypothetical protein
MSRTIRTLNNRKWAEKYNQGQIQKFGLPRYSSKRSRKGKAHVGPGGIGCPCCTKGNPHRMKKWTRRRERNEFDFNTLFRYIEDNPVYIEELKNLENE